MSNVHKPIVTLHEAELGEIQHARLGEYVGVGMKQIALPENSRTPNRYTKQHMLFYLTCKNRGFVQFD